MTRKQRQRQLERRRQHTALGRTRRQQEAAKERYIERLPDMTREALVEVAKGLEISGYSKLKKPDLMKRITKAIRESDQVPA